MLFTDLSSERVVNALTKVGYRVVNEGKHIGMSDGKRRLTIPRHKRINPYTLKGIIKDAGLTDEQFKEPIKCRVSKKSLKSLPTNLHESLLRKVEKQAL